MKTASVGGKTAGGLKVPVDVYGSLVDSLFGEARSLFIGSFAASLGATVTAYKTGEWLLLLCALIIVVVTMLRVLLMRAYRAQKDKIKTESQIRRWEVRYAIGASVYVALLGIFCFISFVFTDDSFAHLISFGTVTAYLIGVSGRNFASNTLIVSQILCASIPVIAGLVWMGSYYFAVVGLVLLPLMLAMKFISSSLKETLLKAVINARDVTVLAKRFDTALNNMPHGLAMFDADSRLIVHNRRFLELLQLKADSIHDTTDADSLADACSSSKSFSEDESDLLRAAFLGDVTGSAEDTAVMAADGRSLALAVQPMDAGGWVTIVQDITERRAAERQIKELATVDTLTGLPNRYSLRKTMSELGDRRLRHGYAVLFVDLDHFKQVNDTLGHQFGDALLFEVASRLKTIAGEKLRVARFGGDEFVVLIPRADASAAAVAAKQIIQELSLPYEIQRHKVIIGTSVGIAVGSREMSDPDKLLRDADTALYEAKNQGRGRWCFFRPEMAIKALTRRTLELDMRTAVEQGAFQLAFQPLHNLHTGRFSTCEALLRWNHPDRGPVSPAEFIPIAEETGLIVPIGRWVLIEACEECKRWPPAVSVAVNLSSVQFRYDDIAATVAEALTITGLDPNRLEVEITESTLLKEEAGTLSALERLRGLGVQISLDDFGTGYSSLSYLRSFRFNKVKVDRSFIRELATDTSSRILLRGIARLSSELGMRVTVEGIETDEQMQLLAGFAFIDEIQGFFFSRPLAPQAIRDLLDRDHGSALVRAAN